MLALMDRTADLGLPNNREKFRPLTRDIYEFKAGGIRVFCFFQQGGRLICARAANKPKPKRLAQEIRLAQTIRAAFLSEIRSER